MSERDVMIGRLAELMRGLYETDAFYVSVPPGEAAGFEEEYWHVVVDPDGNARDRLVERDRTLADLGTELAFLRSLPGGRILDAGCGLGWLLSALGDEWDRCGLELSAYAAEHARQFGDVRTAPVEECPFPDAHFDVVVCHHVIEHVPEPERAIAELRRVLRPGGRLVLGTPDFDSGAARRFGADYRLLRDPTHISLFSNDSMHRFLRAHGFHIDAVDYPFFETRHFTADNLVQMLDRDDVSPPFYGSFMTFYCTRV